jgi:alkylated DNA repair dioxygenase AlkB
LKVSLTESPLLHLSSAETLLDGLLDFYPQAVNEPDKLLRELLHSVPWSQGSILIYGREHRIPRLQCWIADNGLDYTYSGKQLPITPWQPLLSTIRSELNRDFNLQLNSVLCNLYRNGQDSMGWHSDDEKELGEKPGIISITLGAERDFALRRTGSSRQAGKIALPSGSLLYMKPGMQTLWQHAVPRRAGITQPRINLTFREIIPAK